MSFLTHIDNSSTQQGRPVMTPLRQQMIAALQLSGKSERTQQSSVREGRLLAQFYRTSPDLISEQELQQYLLHRKISMDSRPVPCISVTVASAYSTTTSLGVPGRPSTSCEPHLNTDSGYCQPGRSAPSSPCRPCTIVSTAPPSTAVGCACTKRCPCR